MENTKKAYIDESGYTGRDLLNSEQPFMSVSALVISSEEADILCSRYFDRVQAGELKHKVLVRKSTYFSSLLSIQKECLDDYKGISYIVDKKYMCILKLLDDCIEPVWYGEGIDFNADGNNHALASLLYLTAPVFWGKELFDELLRLYQMASTCKTDESIEAFCRHAQKLDGLQVSEVLWPITNRHPLFIQSIRDPQSTTDIAIPMLFGLLSKLEEYADGPYEIIHDKSPAMRKYHRVLEMLQKDEAKAKFHISDVCRVSYPLHLLHVREADSKSERGLQLADILSGGIVNGFRAAAGLDSKNNYNKFAIDNYSDHNLMHMFPNSDFKEIRQRFDGNEVSKAIDHVAYLAAKNSLKIRD